MRPMKNFRRDAIPNAKCRCSEVVTKLASHKKIRGMRVRLLHFAAVCSLIAMFTSPLPAQGGPGTISTVAGNGLDGFAGDGGLAVSARLNRAAGVAVDAAGNLFIADSYNHRVRKVSTDGTITTVAGGGTPGIAGDGGLATAARLDYPSDVAVDSTGNLFIADGSNNRIRKVSTDGVITTVAGNGSLFYSGDGGPAILAGLQALRVAVGAGDNLFIADSFNRRIRKVTPNGLITTVAGNGMSGFSGDGGLAISARLTDPSDMAVDALGNLFIADSGNFRIRKVTPQGIITTIAGNGSSTFGGDGGPAISAGISPGGLAVSTTGTIYITGHYRLRKITSDGVITTVAGNGSSGFTGDGGQAMCAPLYGPVGVDVDATGNLFFTDIFRVRRVAAGSPLAPPTITGLTTTWGAQGASLFAGIQGTGLCGATRVIFSGTAVNVTIEPGVSESSLPIRISIATGAAAGTRTVTVVASNGSSIFSGFTVGTSGRIATVAGQGTAGFGGDNIQAVSARLNWPADVAVDAEGNLFIADTENDRIRKVDPGGVVTTVAGNGTRGFSGDGGAATAAQLHQPTGVAVDVTGNLFIAGDNRVRKVAPNGRITTVAGNGSSAFSGDGGPAISAGVSSHNVTVDSLGNLFIADIGNNRVRKVGLQGTITTVAGNGSSFFTEDGVPATSTGLNPFDVAVDAVGNLFIADFDNHRVRKVSPQGTITTVAGTGIPGSVGDGGPATSAKISYPASVTIDRSGNLFIVAGIVRKVDSAGTITTAAGNLIGDGPLSGPDCSPAASISLYSPAGLAVDADGSLYIAENGAHRVRKVGGSPKVTAVIPDKGAQGKTINANVQGNNLSCATAVTFSGTGVTGVISAEKKPTSVPVTIEVKYSAALGQRNVTITTPDETSPPFSGFEVTALEFSIPERGLRSFISDGSQSTTAVGYARMEAKAGSSVSSALAIFGFRQDGILVSEASVPASPLLQTGRIYAEINGAVNTGLAIANPNSQSALIAYTFYGTSGQVLATGTTTIAANAQVARFLDQDPFWGPNSMQGSFDFSSSVPISAIALRTRNNERQPHGDFLVTTLPVIDTSAAPNTGTQVIPHFAVGSGWTTQIVLVNSTSAPQTGTVEFFNQGTSAGQGSTSPGTPALVSIDGSARTGDVYSIAARSSQKFLVTSAGIGLSSGSVRVVPSGIGAAPVPLVLFSFKPASVTTTEASVAVTMATAFRVYVETSSAPPISSGIAIANASNTQGTITLELTNLDGIEVVPSQTRNIPAFGQVAGFLNDFFGNLKQPLQGVLRVTTSSPGVSLSVVALRQRYNERGDYLITTTPPTIETLPPPSADRYFPHIANGGGWTTQFILYSGISGETPEGILRFFKQDGATTGLDLN